MTSDEARGQAKQADKDFITTLIGDLGLTSNFKAVYRLGNPTNGEMKTLIKVTMNTEDEKSNIINSLTRYTNGR